MFDETQVLSIICGKCSSNDEKIFKGKESIEILKILGIINNMNEYQMIMKLFKKWVKKT